MNRDEKLTVSDWLTFLETRSGNYLSALSIGASAVTIVVSILGLRGGLPSWMIITVLISTLMILQALASWMLKGSIIVEVLEAKRIANEITESRLKTVEQIEEAWKRRKGGFWSWLTKRLKETISH